jgi:chromodomain-helicase-DNA-binding protein 4
MIDDTLKKRGQLHLIYGQPLRVIEKVKSGVSGSTKADKRDNSKVLPTQPSSRPKTASGLHLREGVKRGNSKGVPTQPSSSRPKIPSDPHFLIREGVGSSGVPSSSTSAKGWPTVTPAPRKRPSDTPNSAMKKQKTGKYPGCPICGGPHHFVKDCPITAEGPKRYSFLVSDFMTSLLITLWIVYALQSSDWSLNQGKLLRLLLSVRF